MEKIEELKSPEEFVEKIKNGKCLIQFYSKTQGEFCRKLSETLNKIAFQLKEEDEISIFKVNVDEEVNDDILNFFEIKFLPTMVLLENSYVKDRATGYDTEDKILEWVLPILGKKNRLN